MDLRTADDHRAVWNAVEQDWAGAVARASLLPEAACHERVDGEFSFVETLRHLVFATDAWVSRPILGDPAPYHPFGIPDTSYVAPAALGLDAAARPSFAEVLAVRADRMAVVGLLLDGLTDGDLARMCTLAPVPDYRGEPHPVGYCLGVLLTEERAHHGYASRDLTVLESHWGPILEEET